MEEFYEDRLLVRDNYVYALVCVETNKVFYIGRATNRGNGYYRFADHLALAANGSPLPVHAEMRRIQSIGQNIRFEVRCTGMTYKESVESEANFIRNIGLDNLTNVYPSEEKTNKGEKRPPLTPAQRNGLFLGQIASHYREIGEEEKSRLRGQANNRARKFFVKDLDTKEIHCFGGRAEAARFLGVGESTLFYGAKRKNVVRGRGRVGRYLVSQKNDFPPDGTLPPLNKRKASVNGTKVPNILSEFL